MSEGVKIFSKSHHFQTSPDCSVNPFCGAKRNEKIGTESGRGVSTMFKCSASKNIKSVNCFFLDKLVKNNVAKVVYKVFL